MADALISNGLNSLNTFLQRELGHGLGVDVSNELKNLSFTLTAIQPLLYDAETQQLGNSSVRDWLCKLKDVAYDLDNILDQCRTLHLTSKLNEDYKSILGEVLVEERTLLVLDEACGDDRPEWERLGAEYDDDGNITQFKMLGLVHDIAQHITESEYCTVDNEKLDHISVKSCHFSFISYNMSSFSSLSNKLENSRTLLVLGGAIGDSMPIDLFDQTKFLRALDLSGSKVSNFLVGWRNHHSCSHFVRLDLFDCRNCRQLPTLGKLPSVKYLKILGFDAIERVGCAFFGNGAAPFPKLEQLKFSFMPNWEEWEFKVEDGAVIMPSLLDLSFLACDKLKSLPAIGKLPSLNYLKIEACAAFKWVDREFYANGSDNVMGVAFPKLEKLILKYLRHWKDWELRVQDGETSMPHLCKLTISNCPVLKSLPCHLPDALRKFTIECCDELTWRPLPCHPIPHLEEFILRGGQKEVLPGSWPYLPNLKKLDIEEALRFALPYPPPSGYPPPPRPGGFEAYPPLPVGYEAYPPPPPSQGGYGGYPPPGQPGYQGYFHQGLQAPNNNLEQLTKQGGRDEVGLLVGVKKELKKLSDSFTAIQAGLEDAENQQVTKKAVQDWLGKLKDVAYEMVDVLEEWRIEDFRSQEDEDDILKHKTVRFCFLFPFSKREVDDKPKMNERETSSVIDESEIFGRDTVKDEFVNELVSETSKEKRPFSVVSIVGMGGLSKTTLAQLVYNDETIMKHFEKRIWVCVSEDYDVNKILTKVIQSMGGSTDGDLDLDTLHQRINALAGKNRFLLMLDDVWDEILWEKLRVPLKGAAPGSGIVVTTRSRTVADVMEMTRLHDLGILSDSGCWKLFTSRAFRGRKEEEWLLELTEVDIHPELVNPDAIELVSHIRREYTTKLDQSEFVAVLI
ncbi:hypothetical protein MRB53_008292 [Persea americana]|uniref:Uncharacterized protein n=1 Tax=Persea americana TaxID=3435 RepID=A0ACC2MMI9_PERAE|nr:hypothetical protein MRB53_008292 [Persea americana]